MTNTLTPSSAMTEANARSFHHAVILAAPDAFVAIDADDRILEWSPRAQALFGWQAAEVMGRRLSEVILPPNAAGATIHLATLASEGPQGAATHAQRMELQRQDQSRFTAEAQLTPVETGGNWRAGCFFRDITDTLHAEQQLLQAQKLEAIGHLTGGLAHDFNNILGIIIGSLDLVVPALEGAQERELVGAALTAAHRGAEVTRALLAVARKRILKPQPTDVNLLIDELAPLLRQTAGKRIEVSFSPNAIEAVCNIDPGGLNNALVNLVINARDAMPRGGRIVVYAYSTDILPGALIAPLRLEPGTYVVIGVDDTGSGMSPDVAQHAFDPFFTTKTRGQGTGLGLAMVYGFARQSGGAARIQSTPRKGTSVQILIPACAEPPHALPSQGTPGKQDAALRILFVDDEHALQQSAEQWLGSLGHTVTLAGNAEAALARLAETRFDLLITDIVMPGEMDGMSLVERCRRMYPEMPVLLTTDFADGVTVAMQGRCEVLGKPYTRTTLRQAIAETLRRHTPARSR